MFLMHTKLPEFVTKIHAAAERKSGTSLELRGLEHLSTAKMQSLRTGRIEHAVEELANREEVERVEVCVLPRVPETMHTVVVKGIGADGTQHKAILEVVNILHPTEEVELEGVLEVEDRRPSLGRH
jgi:hypothetical protein